MIETVVTIAIVAATLLIAVRWFFKVGKGEKGCGCGCGACGKKCAPPDLAETP